MKPGYRTSEFYVVILAQMLASLLVILGFVKCRDAHATSEAFNAIVVAGQTYLASHYIKSRTALKKETQSTGEI